MTAVILSSPPFLFAACTKLSAALFFWLRRSAAISSFLRQLYKPSLQSKNKSFSNYNDEHQVHTKYLGTLQMLDRQTNDVVSEVYVAINPIYGYPNEKPGGEEQEPSSSHFGGEDSKVPIIDFDSTTIRRHQGKGYSKILKGILAQLIHAGEFGNVKHLGAETLSKTAKHINKKYLGLVDDRNNNRYDFSGRADIAVKTFNKHLTARDAGHAGFNEIFPYPE